MRKHAIIIFIVFTCFLDSGTTKSRTRRHANLDDVFSKYIKYIYGNEITSLKKEVGVLSVALNTFSTAPLMYVLPSNVTKLRHRRDLTATENGCPMANNVRERLKLPSNYLIKVMYAGMSNPSDVLNGKVVQTCKECRYDIILPGYHPSQIRHVECPQGSCMFNFGLCASIAMEIPLYFQYRGQWISQPLTINKGCACQMHKSVADTIFG